MSDRSFLRDLGSTPWPWLLVILLVAGFGYMDLRLELAELEYRIRTVESSAATSIVSAAGDDASRPVERSRHENDDCTGTVSPEAIRRVLAARGQQVFACYEVRSAREVRGVLDITLRVARDGHVESVSLTGAPARDADVSGCLGPELEGWSFGAIDSDCAIVSLPFALGGLGNPLPENAPAGVTSTGP